MFSETFNKIKKSLSKRKGILIFVGLIVFSLVFFPGKARAQFVDIMNIFNSMMEGVEDIELPLAMILIKTFITFAAGLITVFLASNILQITLESAAVSIKTSTLVQAGWNFSAGIANLFLILIFVVIAIAYILKIESFQAKKSFVRLIAVALLMNFSLVFIGMAVDVANVLYNTVLSKGGPDFIVKVTSQLTSEGLMTVVSIGAWLIALVVAYIIPVVGPFVMLAFAIMMVTVNLPALIVWMIQIVIFFMLGGILFTYIFLFAARGYIIQILAALSPLAFLCLVMPQTKKYWDQWLHHLVGWLLVGILVLFFLIIGSKMTSQLSPPGALAFVPILGFFVLGNIVSYYLFIFIFLAVLLFVSKKSMPEFASFLIDQAKSMGNMAWQRVGKPIAGAAMKTSQQILERPGWAGDKFKRRMEQSRVGALLGFQKGDADAALAKRANKAAKKLEGRNPEDLREIVKKRNMSYDDKIGALGELARQGKFDYKKSDPETKRYVELLQKSQTDMKPLLQNRPDLAPFVIDREQSAITGTTQYFTTEGSIARMDPGTLRQKIDAEALKDEAVLWSMNRKQIEQIGKRGTDKQKETIKNLVTELKNLTSPKSIRFLNHYNSILADKATAQASGLLDEAQRLDEQAKRLEAVIDHIETNIDFK